MPAPKLKEALCDREITAKARQNAEKALWLAKFDFSCAQEKVKRAICAKDRLKDARSVIKHHSEELKRDTNFSINCAKVLISAYRWNGYQDKDEIIPYVENLMPWLSPEAILPLFLRSHYYTSKEAADKMRVTLAIRQKLGLTQFKASDLSEDEFDTWRATHTKEKDKARQNAKRRAAGKPTAQERKAANEAKKAYYQALADEHEISVATVRRRIKNGIFPDYITCKSEIHPTYLFPHNSTDATFAKAQAANAHQACSEPSIFFDTTKDMANAALALKAAAAPIKHKPSIINFPNKCNAGGATKAPAATGEIMHIQKTIEVGRVAMKFGLSVVRAMPTDMSAKLIQSKQLDDRLQAIKTNFENGGNYSE